MPADEFRLSLLEWSFPRNKSKIKRISTNEILPSYTTGRKFNREMNSETFLQNKNKNKKEERKLLKFKELFSQTYSQISSSKLYLKFATLYLFYPFLSRFYCIKFATLYLFSIPFFLVSIV